MSIRVFVTINITAIAIQSAMAFFILSARVMLVPFGPLYARGRERTCRYFHPAFARPIEFVVEQHLIHFFGKMNDVLAEMILLQPRERSFLFPEHATSRMNAQPE